MLQDAYKIGSHLIATCKLIGWNPDGCIGHGHSDQLQRQSWILGMLDDPVLRFLDPTHEKKKTGFPWRMKYMRKQGAFCV
jgi:hypothetical protein